MTVQVPDHDIISRVHAGKMFSVYSAKDNINKKNVYIKAVNSKYPDTKEIALLQHEYELANAVQSPFTLKILDYIEYHNTMALVLEAVPDGICLREWMTLNKMTLDQFFQIAIGITEGLKAIHKQNIIHKDIKPDNIIVSSDLAHIKIIDFGASVQVSREMPQQELSKKLCGSLPYIAPEQTGVTNECIDYRADFYSLGCTLYEMLAKKTPFNGESLWEWINFHTESDAKPLYLVDESIPICLSDLVDKLMAKKPHDRYQSSYGLCVDLNYMKTNINEKDKLDCFQIAMNDCSDKFILSNEMFGREDQLDYLINLIQDDEKDRNQVISVNGYSGIGKTVFVKSLESILAPYGVKFAYGKFEQFNNNLPFQAISEALQRFFNNAILKDANKKKIITERFSEELQGFQDALVDLVPSLSVIVHPKTSSSATRKDIDQHQFYAAVVKFLNMITSPKNPLVMCLDDLQWADIPSLKLLKYIIVDSNVKNLHILLTYRSNQLKQSYTLAKTLQEIDELGLRTDVGLKRLSAQDVLNIVKDTLRADESLCKPLSEIVFRRTAGNPYFAKSLLFALYQEKIINFNYEKGGWEYDLSKVEDFTVSDGIAEFMADRISRLTDSAKSILSIASCIGMKFSAQTLSAITGLTVYEIINALKEPIEKNIIDIYSGQHNLYTQNFISELSDDISIRFIHDKTQQAAYSLLSDEQKKQYHYQIGEYMLAELYAEKCNSILVAKHFNKAKDLVNSREQRIEIAQVNFKAGMHAMRSNAYESAHQFFIAAKEFLPEGSWDSNYQLCWDIHYRIVKTAYLAGIYDNYQTIIELTIARSHHKIEKAKLLRMKMLMEIVLSNYDDAVVTGLKGLNLFDVKIRKEPPKIQVIRLLLKIKQKAKKITVDKIMSQNLIDSANDKMVLTLISELLTPAYYVSEKTNKSLFPTLVMYGVLYSIQHGMTKESGYLFEVLSVLFSAILKDFKKAKEFAELGKLWVEKHKCLSDLCRTQFVYSTFTLPWNEPLHAIKGGLEQAIEYGLMSGDQQYLSYAAFHISLYDPEMTFDGRAKLCRENLTLIDKTEHYAALYTARFISHYWDNLSDDEKRGEKIKSEDFSEEKFLSFMLEKEVYVAVVIYHLLKISQYFYYRKFNEAIPHIKKLKKYRQFILGLPLNIDLSLFTFLNLTNIYPELGLVAKIKARFMLKREMRQMKVWYTHNPDCFAPFYWLMKAEQAKINGFTKKACLYYENASNAAKNVKYLRYDSIICEQYGRYLLDLGELKLHTNGVDRLKEAMVLNNRIHCVVKQNQLKKLLNFEDGVNDIEMPRYSAERAFNRSL